MNVEWADALMVGSGVMFAGVIGPVSCAFGPEIAEELLHPSTF